MTTGIEPPSFVFFVTWGSIFLWQSLWIIYLLTTLCRKREDEYLYIEPDVWPPAILLLFMLNNAGGITWLFVHNRGIQVIKFVPLMVMFLSLYIALAISAKRLTSNSAEMVQLGLKIDIWLIRLLVHNGFGIYAAWTTIGTLIEVCVAMTYSGSFDTDIIVTAIYAVLLLILLFWFFIDMSFLDRWTRYLFTPYCVFAFALAGLVYDDHDLTKRNSIFTVVLLGIAGVFLIVKMVVMIWRHKKRPLLESDGQKL